MFRPNEGPPPRLATLGAAQIWRSDLAEADRESHHTTLPLPPHVTHSPTSRLGLGPSPSLPSARAHSRSPSGATSRLGQSNHASASDPIPAHLEPNNNVSAVSGLLDRPPCPPPPPSPVNPSPLPCLLYSSPNFAVLTRGGRRDALLRICPSFLWVCFVRSGEPGAAIGGGRVATVAAGRLWPASAPAARVRRRPTGRSRRRCDPRRGAPQARLWHFYARLPGTSSIAPLLHYTRGSIWVLGLFARDRIVRRRSLLQGGASAAAAAAGSDVDRFIAAVERLRLPSFAASDLDKVLYSPLDHHQLLLPFSSVAVFFHVVHIREKKSSVGFSCD